MKVIKIEISGESQSGKSTIASNVFDFLARESSFNVELIEDGSVIRLHETKSLGLVRIVVRQTP